jgi:predicted metal-dependent hydrolase
MLKKIELQGRKIEYNLRKKRGVRSVRLSIHSDGSCVVTAPKWYPLYLINNFITSKADWIWQNISHIDFTAAAEKRAGKKAEYAEMKKLAKIIAEERVKFFNHHYNFQYNRISIRNQRTCWGSCSRKGNLNFNYAIIKLPEELRDYVIVHELCHLKELNHSKRFWNLVRVAIPEYKDKRKKLKSIKN